MIGRTAREASSRLHRRSVLRHPGGPGERIRVAGVHHQNSRFPAPQTQGLSTPVDIG